MDKLFYAQEHLGNPFVTERYLKEIEKRKETHIEVLYTLYYIFQDTFFYVCTIKGLGQIYQ